MVLCTVGHEKFPLAFPFKKSKCPRQALIELIAPPQFTLALHVLEIANLCLLYSQWITSTPTTCLHEDVCVWCQSRPAWNRQTDRPATGLGWSCGKSLASRSMYFYQQYHYHHRIYRTIWLWQKREVTSKHISARTTEWCINIYKCNSLKSWTEGWHGAKNHLEDDKTMLRSLSQKN